jgi:hypothetical protein
MELIGFPDTGSAWSGHHRPTFGIGGGIVTSVIAAVVGAAVVLFGWPNNASSNAQCRLLALSRPRRCALGLVIRSFDPHINVDPDQASRSTDRTA